MATVMGVVLVILGVAVPRSEGATSTATAWSTTRISGSDRFATAAALSARAFPNGSSDVVLASGTDFADALAASPTAARRHAPLLLTYRDSLPSSTLTEIRRLRPRRVVIAGGPVAVSTAVEYALGLSFPVTRLAGADRFATAAKLADASFGTGAPVVFLAPGRSFPDALAAGAAAGRLGGPVLLVEQSRLTDAVSAELEHLRPAKIVLVGGTNVIGTQVQAALGNRTTVQRVAGADRYATAAALVDAVPGPSTVGLVASGTSFPDALAAGPSAAALGGDFALAGPGCLTTAAAQRLADDGVRELVVVGGVAALPAAAATPCTSVSPPTTAPPSQGVPVLTPQGAVPGDSPDPTILKVGGRWYAYSTQVYLAHLPVRTSTDLRTWSGVAEAMPVLASWVAEGRNWAPSVVQDGSTFVAWYAARDRASGRQCVSRAVGTSPSGPFVDELGAAPVCQLSLGGSIDPNVFTDADGSRWLTWKSDENALGHLAHLWVARLSSDARTLTGAPRSILGQDASWEAPTIEQPALVRNGSTYVLFYSGGWWESSGYGVGYATGPSPTGPFTKKTTSRAWLATTGGAAGPGALDPFVGPNGQLWATYHAWPGVVGYAAGGSRTMRVAKLQL